MMKCMKNNKKKAFTLAEILLSLTVIGIVAAIALPSLLGNANERAWATQKKALHTRMSQAIPLLPSVNGYGTLAGTLPTNKYEDQSVTSDTAAATFVRDGLSKVMKMTNICTVALSDSDPTSKLKDCGLPDKIIPLGGGTPINLSEITTLGGLNPKYVGNEWNQGDYGQLDTKAAAFETPNGESVLVYYSPNCQPNLYETTGTFRYIQYKMCANFIYDLNGIKGPNTMGKDIGFMSVFYSTDSSVVAPIPLPTTESSIVQTNAANTCKTKDPDSRVPSLEEVGSMFTNRKLLADSNNSLPTQTLWTTTSTVSGQAWKASMSDGYSSQVATTGSNSLRCVKR